MLLDRTLPPPSKKIESVSFARARSVFLSEKIPMHIIDAGQHDILRLEIILKSGKWYEEKNGEAFFTSQMILEGTSKMSSASLAEQFDFHGAHITMNSGIDYNTLTVYVLNDHLGPILEIIKACLLDSVFPEEELNILKDIKREQIRINKEKNAFIAGQEIRKLLYGDRHPYGRSLDIQDLDEGINAELLHNYYNKTFLSGIEIIVSGRINDTLLNQFNTLSEIISEEPSNRLHQPDEIFKTRHAVQKKESLQSSLRIARRVIHKPHKDFIGLLILNEIFGGFFGSRLMKNIREEKGYTYGIHSGIVSHLHGSLWVIGCDVRKEFVEDTIIQINHESDRLRNDLVAREEMDQVRNYMLGNFLSSLETSFALADKFKNIYFFGQDYTYYDQYIDKVRSITPAEIRDLACRYLIPSSFKTVVVG